jgi:hypothetical protein
VYCVAVLAAGAPELAPFMADECLLAMPDMEGIDYTMKEYMKLVEKTRECVERLNSQGDLFCIFNYKLKALEKDPVHGWIPQSRQKCQAFSSVVRIGSPRPITHRQVLHPPSFSSKRGGGHSLAGEGAGGANSDEGTDIMVGTVL